MLDVAEALDLPLYANIFRNSGQALQVRQILNG